MIRFIDLGKQVDEEVDYFAFYDTVTGEFLKFADCIWSSLPELLQEMREMGEKKEKRVRLASLVPKKFHEPAFQDAKANVNE